MKALVFLIIMTLQANGCEKNVNSDVWDVGIQLLVSDSKGIDLLNATTQNFMYPKKASVSYIIDDKAVRQFEANLDCPSKFCLRSKSGRSFIALTPNDTLKEEFPVTLIHWSDNDVDTVRCHFIRNSGNVICDKVWYNGVLKYPNEAISGYQRAFRIIK